MKQLILLLSISFVFGQKMLIPMDQSQNDHLKAYGIAYFTLTKNTTIEWLLNYRGGSFLIDAHQFVQTECRIRGVTFEPINVNDLVNIYSEIDQGNMDIVLLEKKPKIAIYTPPNKNFNPFHLYFGLKVSIALDKCIAISNASDFSLVFIISLVEVSKLSLILF